MTLELHHLQSMHQVSGPTTSCPNTAFQMLYRRAEVLLGVFRIKHSFGSLSSANCTLALVRASLMPSGSPRNYSIWTALASTRVDSCG
jgi:hypothetical protein